MATTMFGQIIVGPPGSGKSTYCEYISQSLRQLGRNAKIVNLDPANDCLPYKPAIDVMNFINVQKIMEERSLGPNGAMIYCIEHLNDNFGWLYDQIVTLLLNEKDQFEEMQKSNRLNNGDDGGSIDKDNTIWRPYLIFDCPGQSELFNHNKSMRELTDKLTKRQEHFDLRLVCLNLCDANHANDLGKFISIAMNSLRTMANLELPHLNVLSKVDLIEKNGKTRFNLDFYCELPNLKYLLETELESPFFAKYRELSMGLIEIIEDYSLVFFTPLDIQKPEDILNILQLADKANGYYINDLDLSILQMNPRLMEMASGRRLEPLNDATT